MRTTVDHDVWFKSITAVPGQGIHHQVLGVDPDKAKPDGIAPCTADTTTWYLLFAAGIGSPPLNLPDGVAGLIPAGAQVVVQLHLLNASMSAISANAVLDFTASAPVDTAHQAQLILAGPPAEPNVTPSIPVGVGQQVTGKCTLSSASHVFAVFPHMHQIGKHMKIDLTVGGATQTLSNADFNFNEQTLVNVPPIAVNAGDRISVACTYDNNTAAPVQFGPSSTQEMCYAITYLYPPVTPGAFGPNCFQ
jgi:hypothetical protein